MIQYKSREEVVLIRESCRIVSDTLALLASNIQVGMSTLALDRLAEAFIRSQGGVPAFKGYRGFPASLCISINKEVVHGIPREDVRMNDGDLVSIDCGVLKGGYFGDAAYTFPVGNVTEEHMKLCQATLLSLYKGLASARCGMRLGDIGHAIQSFIEGECGYGVVRELVGHGIGKELHEEPVVSNVGKRGSGPLLRHGLVIAVEPMVNLGKREVAVLDDHWTVVSRDESVSAHYEHTVAIFREGTEILSDHSGIALAIASNPCLRMVDMQEEAFALQ